MTFSSYYTAPIIAVVDEINTGDLMKQAVVIVGMGEMGGVFARGFLAAGYPVYPVTRAMNMQTVAEAVDAPELVLIAVAEAELHSVLQNVPDSWRDRLVLLQNELLPADWQQYELDPTVISVWFEKKKGMDTKVLIPSPVNGKHAATVASALAKIDIASEVIEQADAMLNELVIKNVYILTTNIAGLECGGTVSELWQNHRELAEAVSKDVIQLQSALTGKELESKRLVEGMLKAFDGDPEHGCMGRSAPARLARALKLADSYDLQLPALQRISQLSQG